MTCPYFLDRRGTGTSTQCLGAVVPFEPSAVDQFDFCTSGRHRQCSLYRSAAADLLTAIHREVARAIG